MRIFVLGKELDPYKFSHLELKNLISECEKTDTKMYDIYRVIHRARSYSVPKIHDKIKYHTINGNTPKKDLWIETLKIKNILKNPSIYDLPKWKKPTIKEYLKNNTKVTATFYLGAQHVILKGDKLIPYRFRLRLNGDGQIAYLDYKKTKQFIFSYARSSWHRKNIHICKNDY